VDKKKISLIIVLIFFGGFFIGQINTDLLTNNVLITESNTNNKIVNYETNVDSLLHIRTQDDIVTKRNQLINYVWKEAGFPTSMPSSIEVDIIDADYSNMNNLQRIDKITIEMENGVNSVAYLFHPVQSNNKLIIYHHGHDGGFIEGKKTIAFFLNNNYTVLTFSMPLTGMNTQPVVVLPNSDKIRLESHNHFYLLDSDQFSSIKYFLEPIAIALNHLDSNYDFDAYYMVGISGGGWTTTLYSAIDPRINQSYSIAGSLPMYLRSSPRDLGDYEQILPSIYRIANYLDLYVLDSYGENRKHVQIFNKYDPCCFSDPPFETYENEIKSVLSKLGQGSFAIYLDETHKEHKISDNAMSIILEHIKE
jgi:pimeloyl-ACP methyl ester carboxylesterase